MYVSTTPTPAYPIKDGYLFAFSPIPPIPNSLPRKDLLPSTVKLLSVLVDFHDGG